MNRVTKAMLEPLADTINNETESPLKAWIKERDGWYK